MEASITISKMMGQSTIVVPPYQRAYSWDVSKSGEVPKQVNQFLKDLLDFKKSGAEHYYLGHFLYERQADGDKCSCRS